MCKYYSEKSSKDEILKLLSLITHCKISVCNKDMPYILPMYFSYTYKNDRLWIYLTTSEKSKILVYLKENSNVCLEFELSVNKIIYTIIAKGKMINLQKNSDDEYRIDVLTEKISGRKFDFAKEEKKT